ncbi:hypothetical protein IR010_00490 [Flavobacterium sp. MR2016-29]|uniref:hypothetical protein n=1 Tax=Flavobacterium sp. MR2016-29 TaxID=2783795 RepID=UPI00188C8B6E|nr:hypothetical protein [Flavobacterium sp. MR2016-29]MBF4490999.1 hypothetical protein [Flavobacterium sp. MR2016-29]
MKKNILILILIATWLLSCKQDNNAIPNTVDKETLYSVKNIQSKKRLTNHNDKDIYTKYKYIDSNGASLIIQNSFPKGGNKYTDPNRVQYVYAVFWTRITNETDNSLELKIDFPIDSYEIPALPGKYYKTLIPSDTMTIEKAPLFNYGLTNLESFLDNNIHKSPSLKRIIKPKESSGFYVVVLRLTGGTQYGILRTELSLKGQNLFYKIRDKEIHCGSINLKNLTLHK